MAARPLTCSDCSAPITRQSKTGRCRVCACRVLEASPDFHRRRAEGIRRSLMENPARKDAARDRLLAAASLPHAVEARRRKAIELRIWERGHAALAAGSEPRLRGGKRRSETVMAWCPPKLRELYRTLVYTKKFRAADAKRLVLEEHEVEMRRWRRSIGAEPPPPPPLGAGVSFIDRASSVAAHAAGVALIWTNCLDRPAVRARQVVFLALRRGGWSWCRIANETGMARKTVKHGVARAEILVSGDPTFAELYRKVCAA